MRPHRGRGVASPTKLGRFVKREGALLLTVEQLLAFVDLFELVSDEVFGLSC